MLLGIVSFIVLLVTGFGPLWLGYRLSGWLLIVHAAFAPVFIGCAALLALGWAEGMIFRGGSDAVEKLCFWLLIFLSLPLALSMILSMFTFFGTAGQDFLLVLHRWSGVAFGCIALIFFYLLVRRQVVMENTKLLDKEV